MKLSFFASLWGVCCGTRVFPVLKGHSVPRTLAHLALMSLLCAFVITWGSFGRAMREYAKFLERYDEAFGSRIRLSAAGIRPEKSPDAPRFIALPSDGGLIYTAGSAAAEVPPGFFSGAAYFVMWSDFGLAFGVRSAAFGDDGEWQVQVVKPDQSFTVRKVGGDGLPAFLNAELARLRESGGRWKLPKAKIGTGELFRFFKRLAAAALFVSELFGIFALGLLCTLFFSLISRLTGAAALRGIGGAEYWKIGVYAGFPGMLVGAVAEALDLPYVSYGIVYSLALVVYWLPASLACTEDRSEDGDGGGRT